VYYYGSAYLGRPKPERVNRPLLEF
jgi:hypothetical protein